MSDSDLDQMVERYHRSLDVLLRGDPEPAKVMFSHRDDVTLANPFGPVARGWKDVARTIDTAAAGFRDGSTVRFERISGYFTPDLAYLVEMEHLKAKLGNSQEISAFSLRVTSVIRREDGVWKVIHRHADPITSPRPPESVLQK